MMKKNRKDKKVIEYLIFAGPTTFAFLVVLIIPFLYGIFLTFTNWNGIASSFNFTLTENYVGVINDKEFWSSFILTVKYVLCVVVITNAIAFGLAYLLTSGLKLQNLFRAGFFTPNLLGGIILGYIWQFIFSNVLTFFGDKFEIGIFSKSWLGNPSNAFWALVVVTVWQLSGYLMLIYIAGFINIPQSVIEAGKIDGAEGFTKIRKIIMPLMVNAFTISIFLTLQRAFMVYDLNIALTDGGPFNKTRLVSMYVYNKAFLSQEYGLGQAEAFILFLLVAIITVVQVKISKSKEVEA